MRRFCAAIDQTEDEEPAEETADPSLEWNHVARHFDGEAAEPHSNRRECADDAQSIDRMPDRTRRRAANGPDEKDDSEQYGQSCGATHASILSRQEKGRKVAPRSVGQ